MHNNYSNETQGLGAQSEIIQWVLLLASSTVQWRRKTFHSRGANNSGCVNQF